MFVSGVRPNEEIYKYNSIKLKLLRKQMVEADKAEVKLDVKKAMSDVAKDFTLQQYQYFVGSRSSNNHDTKTSFCTGERFAL